MFTDIFPNKERRKAFEKYLHEVYPHPYNIFVKNDNQSDQEIKLFGRYEHAPGVTIFSQVPDVTYDEICLSFFASIRLKLLLVRIIDPLHDFNLMRHMKFTFIRKYGRGGIDALPFRLWEEGEGYQEVLFSPIDIKMSPLTYLQFVLPSAAALEIQLFEGAGN